MAGKPVGDGITSTYVENTPSERLSQQSHQDHLHIRGEYIRCGKQETIWLGSPPHTWRIRQDFLIWSSTARITSTYVENTPGLGFKHRIEKDHLHIRGEYSLIYQRIKQKWGSPPHTWRIRNHDPFGWWPTGITSTYVENTSLITVIFLLIRDHLHIRGEYSVTIVTAISYPRITSTYVENTLNSWSGFFVL